ncbi:MAG: DUF58 domain-containing protein [Verrucomicrobia bacterium]|nr:DUF58 domain-containing protein [Verrucomicrobiota bacterium]
MPLVPSSLLLWVVALVGVPLAGAAGWGGSVSQAGWIGLGLLAAVAAVDALLAWQRSPPARITLPETVRLAKEREGPLPLTFRREGALEAGLIRLGAALPREIKAEPDFPVVQLPAGQANVAWNWPLLPRRRGRYLLDSIHLEMRSPFGLWEQRWVQPVRCELRVYPDLRRDRQQIAVHFLPRAADGLRRRRMVGKGREFEKLREYVPGDPPEEIHWKATARRRRPISRVYQIERTQEIYVVLDASRLSARLAPFTAGPAALTGPRIQRHAELAEGDLFAMAAEPPTLLERCIQSALLLGDVASRQGDRFGLVTFTDRVGSFLRARNGVAHAQACREALYALQPRLVSPDYAEICAHLRVALTKRALLVFLTSLDDPVLAEDFRRNIGLLTRQHLVMLPMVRPPEAVPLFAEDPAVTPVANTAALYERAGGHLRWRGLQQTGEALRRAGVHFSLLDQERMTAQLVNAYLDVKGRQLL